MKHVNGSRLVCAIGAVLALALSSRPLAAQTVTSGILSGRVVDQQGATIPGVTIVATHEPTGTKYEAVTGTDGRFQVPNVRVGGPYTVTASLSGFREQSSSNINVGLGEDKAVEFKLQLATVSETITVIAESPIIDTARAGTASNVKAEVIESLPTISRSITDVASTSPYFSQGNSNGGDSFLSVAGRNNRYNNIQIDGAVNNDVFGLAASGTPGGQTGTQPISYDAIQEVQLVVSPYDVRQGGFSGGSINMITRSGTNRFAGTGYWFGRNEGLVGKIESPFDSTTKSPVGRFKDQQGGFSLGGPVVSNKAFFFGNLDLARKTTPNGFSVSGATGQAFGHADEVSQVIGILKNQYGYDPGNTDEFSKRGNSDKVFGRVDFNVSPNNQLMVRANYINGLADQSGTTPSSIIYILPGNFYQITDKTLSTVGELNSTWAKAFNQLRVTYQRERNLRNPGTPFPHLQIDISGGANIRAGSELSSQANQLNQDIVELNDDVTFIKGAHTFTVGTHNEFFKFLNVFIQNYYGQYRFSSIANLQAGIAQGFNHNFSNDPSNALNPAEFSVRQLGFYAGDQWRASSNFTLTYGFRFDAPQFPTAPHGNPLAQSAFGFGTDVVPAPTMFSPRAGFNWDLSNGGSKRSQLRGGLGLFVGRTPYVWLSNQYSNTGVDFTALAVTFNAANRLPFVASPTAQPTSVPGGVAGNQTINLIDPNYKYPEIFRGNLGYDHELGVFGLIGTAEVLFGRNVRDIKYQNLNYIQAGTRSDGRPFYVKKLSTVNDVILLTNSDQGGQWSVSYKVDRSFKSGFAFSGSYLYGQSKSVIDGTSSVAASNFFGLYQAGDIQNPPLTTSDFDVRHRMLFTATIPIPLWHDLRSYASFYYNGQSGRPYSVVFNNDVNGDSRTTNDLVFVPATADQVNVTNGTWAQLDAFLNSDDAVKNYRGQIAPRNTGRAPWTNSLNFRYAVNIPTGGTTKVEATMDIFNLLNLLDSTKGWVWYPNFGGPTIIGATVGADGKYTYNLNTITAANFLAQGTTSGVPGTFTRDDLRSRWQMQWGLRFRF
jgi:hypothetical protein